MDRIKLLIIEDDMESALFMQEFLEEHSFFVDIFTTVTDAIARITYRKYNLIILDLNLPDYDGYEVLKYLNKERYSIPVIVLSAYSDVETKLKAFSFGASDYIVKPVDPNELVARIWVHLKKDSLLGNFSRNISFEIVDNEIYFKGKLLKLTLTEYKILKVLIKNIGKNIKREYLYSKLSVKSNQRSLDSHIKNIRKKIEEIDPNAKNILSTEYGYGYRLVEFE